VVDALGEWLRPPEFLPVTGIEQYHAADIAAGGDELSVW
jgi:hypothetical protein